jgi:hypothetical protein
VATIAHARRAGNWIRTLVRPSLRHAVWSMKHAGGDALDRLEPLLTELRALAGLREKSRGVFYRRTRAFLHFHEDPTGLFADVRFADDFERVNVTSAAEQDALLRRVQEQLFS